MMRNKLPRAIGASCALLLAVGLLPGCKFFDLNNPFLPKARVIAFPRETTFKVTAKYQRSTNTITVDEPDTTVQVQSLPRDASPGVLFNGYSAEYLDQANNAISTLTLTKVNFGVSGYLPPASGTVQSVQMKLPIYTQQVRAYCIDQVFAFVPEVTINRNLIHTINCRVTLYGTDDNFNDIQVPLAVPITLFGDVSP